MNLLNENNIKSLTFSLKTALYDDEKKKIFDLIQNMDRIKKDIFSQKKSMQNLIIQSHKNLSNLLENGDFNDTKEFIDEILMNLYRINF